MGSQGKEPKPPFASGTGHSADDPVSLGEAITPVILRLRGGLPRLKLMPATLDREEDHKGRRT